MKGELALQFLLKHTENGQYNRSDWRVSLNDNDSDRYTD